MLLTSVSMSFGKITKLFLYTERARRRVRCQDSSARQIAVLIDFENPVPDAEKVHARCMKRTVEARQFAAGRPLSRMCSASSRADAAGCVRGLVGVGAPRPADSVRGVNLMRVCDGQITEALGYSKTGAPVPLATDTEA